MSTDAPTNDRQTSERERLANALEQMGQFASSFEAATPFEAAAKLRSDEAEIAQVRAAYERAESDVQVLTREIAALRAENEALRTVTEEDVKSISARTGTMPVDVRLSLQSFIRSKESRRG